MTDIGNAGDLRTAYLQTFDSFGLTPGDIVESSDGRVNNRYARELLGVLTTAGLLVVTDVNNDGDVWQVSNPGTYDEATREEAEAVIDGFLNINQKEEPAMSKTATAPAKVKSTPAKEQTFHPCYCGCKQNVPSKSFYKPGHDARHAGQIGRLVAADGNVDHYNDLPSAKLVAKSKVITAKAIERANKKAGPVEGTVKVGKNEKVARRQSNGNVEVLQDDGSWKAASKAAAKTFAE